MGIQESANCVAVLLLLFLGHLAGFLVPSPIVADLTDRTVYKFASLCLDEKGFSANGRHAVRSMAKGVCQEGTWQFASN